MLTKPGPRKTLLIKFAIDLALAAAASWGAFALRLDLPIPKLYQRSEVFYILLSLAIKVALILGFGLFRQSWRSIGVRDLTRLGKAVAAFTLLSSTAAFLLSPYYRIPRSIPLIDGMLLLLSWGAARLLVRLFLEGNVRRKGRGQNKRVLVIGAGDAGTMIVREMLRHPESCLTPVGFLDDDPGKWNTTFVGYPVFGPVKRLAAVARGQSVDEILIAIPSVMGDAIRSILETARKAEIPARIIPGIWEVLSGKVSISSIRDVEVEDLLNRDPVRLDLDEIAGYITGRVVLVTGAGGSIGSEIVRQILPFEPRHIILLGRGENSLFQIEQELRNIHHVRNITTVVSDVRNRERLRRIFEAHSPRVVFHAAAHKHVPLMEENPEEAILNNVFGTQNLAELALEHAVEVFVNISTDKAVNPTSVMGASKRVAEMIVRSAAEKALPGQAFVSVRFGNVLGSRGSVIPTFKEQIRRGGPVTVTHPEMTRYFMTIPEAAQLVLQAGGMKRNGSVFVLDMGQPVKIIDLASDLIRLSGFEPGTDIDIVFSGIRPGEKLFEELLTAEEGTETSRFKKIFVARNNGLPADMPELLEELRQAAEEENGRAIREKLGKLIPHCRFCREENGK
ncbi:nucleoside-diphosphate sugar epimerase/dehydratase [Aminivibrio sp.]|uniref:polysaccharide biosynthesis protein n=1 Tax=Aminivibrio sp. TaxID=1872489 RepID=UPI001A3F5D4E|nr:nucleoside-diphosphate sugar epimerase/dehydratase [Aminivibrio sp.]MBL3539866.1 polysaccharide biosynthesis protein [Aminivibrio sp.]